MSPRPSRHPPFLRSTPMPTSERGHPVPATLQPSRVSRALVALVALTLVLAACGSSGKSSSGGSSSGSTTLNGSGSTFQKTFNEVAIQAFQQKNPNITVNYAGGGSGKGKTDLQTQ